MNLYIIVKRQKSSFLRTFQKLNYHSASKRGGGGGGGEVYEASSSSSSQLRSGGPEAELSGALLWFTVNF